MIDPIVDAQVYVDTYRYLHWAVCLIFGVALIFAVNALVFLYAMIVFMQSFRWLEDSQHDLPMMTHWVLYTLIGSLAAGWIYWRWLSQVQWV